jgi:hypothetical protein
MANRRKTGASTYYPVRFKPDNFSVNGCDHDDIHLAPLLDGFDPEEAADRYKNNLRYVEEAPNKSQYEKRRLATGISKPTIFSGLDPEHNLGIPDIFGLDFMHLPTLNITDLFFNLWRGLLECDKNDKRALWDWAVLTADVWTKFGQTGRSDEMDPRLI